MKLINRAKQVAAGVLELPKEVALDIPRIVILGHNEVLVENYKAILEYGEEHIRVKTSIGILVIRGRRLVLKRISDENIVVKGAIGVIEYS